MDLRPVTQIVNASPSKAYTGNCSQVVLTSGQVIQGSRRPSRPS